MPGTNQFSGGHTKAKLKFSLETDTASACGQHGYFQNGDLVITIKRPDYIADFLKKSVFYWAGLQTTHTHPSPLQHTKIDRRRGEGNRLACVCFCVCVFARKWTGLVQGYSRSIENNCLCMYLCITLHRAPSK